MLSVDPEQFGSQNGLEYATFDGQSWTVETVGTGPLPYEFGNSIVIDSQDRPHIVWFDAQGQDLKYALRDADGWTISVVDADGDVGRYPSLALDQNDNPVDSYYQTLSDSSGIIKFARWDGSAWTTQTVGQLNDVFPGFLGARKNSSVLLDAGDNPIVAYSDESVVKLASWNGDGWDIETVTTAMTNRWDSRYPWPWTAREFSTSPLLMCAKSWPGMLGTVMCARGVPSAAARIIGDRTNSGG